MISLSIRKRIKMENLVRGLKYRGRNLTRTLDQTMADVKLLYL